jgi:hypothetical protein
MPSVFAGGFSDVETALQSNSENVRLLEPPVIAKKKHWSIF